MPKGQKAIEWTPANDAKLLLTIVAVEDIRPDHEKIATAFGVPGVNASAIQNRMKKLRQKAKEMGAASGSGATPTKSSTKRAVTPNSKKEKPRKRIGGILGEALSEDLSEDESVGLKVKAGAEQEAIGSHDAGYMTPSTSSKIQKTINGRVTKLRLSLRKSGKKDYKAMQDPSVAPNGTIDGDGSNVFGSDKSVSEATYPSDVESAHVGGQNGCIMKEEAI